MVNNLLFSPSKLPSSINASSIHRLLLEKKKEKAEAYGNLSTAVTIGTTIHQLSDLCVKWKGFRKKLYPVEEERLAQVSEGVKTMMGTLKGVRADFNSVISTPENGISDQLIQEETEAHIQRLRYMCFDYD